MTIPQAELVNVEAAAQLTSQEGGLRKVNICSDGMTMLAATQNMITKSNLTMECYNKLNSLAMEWAVEFLWRRKIID